MKIDVLTLYTEIYDVFKSGIIGKALDKKIFELNVHNIREFSKDKHKRCDDYPFGGGAGMVMTPQPLHDAITKIDPEHTAKRIYLSPKGKRFDQKTALSLSKEKHLMFINGSYEGVDQRILDMDVDMELSIGDYVLTSGDYATIVIINAISRYIKGVLGSDESTKEESFSNGLLEYPQYTRPQKFMGLEVPEVLLSGNHAEIQKWRKQKSIEITKVKRPDLLEE
ncbi:MAG: tRNA (guanosine(37)-N1)-methyltransferase TrmD [Bacillota bacterium]|jgi:tRNA (guanine37-N1)-methyltransferase|nr:tRNA (guanosine(37)-N1)-methyltransferase TrmD [Bacillota bacterium]HHU43652.1 tRNA (guanosine(37)-N1)-methyltransferase TrmD [Clostridiales bacterium]